MVAALPLDIYVAFLSHLPPNRTNDESIRVLAQFLRCSKLLREAALVGSLWKAHYRTRYLYPIEIVGSDPQWRILYAERRRADAIALEILDTIASQRRRRPEHVAHLTAMGFHIWDALEIETLQPLPPSLGGDARAKPHMLTRRYWARTAMNIITRRYAIAQWGPLTNDEQSLTFVDAFSVLSCFFGTPAREISDRLSSLSSSCLRYLADERITVDSAAADYRLPVICEQICVFMKRQGFGPVGPQSFHDVSNQFPHLYLTSKKRTIPIALVHVFVHIAHGLGIDASPVGFPTRVLVHIPCPPGQDDFLVDVFGAEVKTIVTLRDDIPFMLMRLGIPPDQIASYIMPCGPVPMLLRAARNILSFSGTEFLSPITQSAIEAAASIHLLFNSDELSTAHMLRHIDLDPLHCTTVLADISVFMHRAPRGLLQSTCEQVIMHEDDHAQVVHRRSIETPVSHRVGKVFTHRSRQYTGVIFGWDTTCAASIEWQRQMRVADLARGPAQPFYQVYSLEGGQRYVAEENISHDVDLTLELASTFLSNVASLPRFFSDAITASPNNPGRWLPSPELQTAYPDDVY
ncbi:unnamed protein product [Mycena citricolor]|uniref:Hemimethylated DNA-binding domain-containing protein n=1 Tax=Mycena citricolor TaxID=2018698 RepID=A0AAD2HTM5_9AGAR|nr:unnamed protein product [Mycena citricolor]